MTPAEHPLRIGIDVRYLSHGLVGGVHTYVTRLLPRMLEAAPADEFVLYADGKARFEFDAPDSVRVRTLPWRSGASSIANDWHRLARWMAEDGIDVAFFPANHGIGPRRAATVVTVHDALNLNPLRRTLLSVGSARSLRGHGIDVYLKTATTWSVRRATRLITMSEYSKQAIVAASGRRADEVTVVYHGAPPKVTVSPHEAAGTVAALGVTTPFVLADGLKNPAVLLRAAARLSAGGGPPFRTVFFARHANVLPELAAAVAAGQATLLVRPSTEALASLYSSAAAFVFPSWIEGFGIPLLEAMTYGAPIIASDRGSIPEIAGDAALVGDADDDETLARHLLRVLSDHGESDRLRALGRQRVSAFTWQRSAQETLGVIRRAHVDRVQAQAARP